MRILWGLLTLSGFTAASTTPDLTYYYNVFSHPSSTTHTPQLSLHEARAALAYRLGLSRFYTLTPAEADRLSVGFSDDNADDLFGERRQSSNVVIEITGANAHTPTNFSPDINPDFTVENGFQLFDMALIAQAEQEFDKGISYRLQSPLGKDYDVVFYIVPEPAHVRPPSDLH